MLTREQAQSLVKKVFSMVDAEQSEVILRRPSPTARGFPAT